MNTSILNSFDGETQVSEDSTPLLDINTINFYKQNRNIFLELYEDDETFISTMEKKISSFEEMVSEYGDELKTMDCDIKNSNDLEVKLDKLRKEVTITYCIIHDKKSTIEIAVFRSYISKICLNIKNLYDCIYEIANYNEALMKLKSINHKICTYDSEDDMFELIQVIKSVELMLMVIKNPHYKIKLRSWLNVSREKYFKYLKVQSSNEMRDFFYEEVEYRVESVIERNKKFQNVVCSEFCEAEAILEELNNHQEEIFMLLCKIDEYEKMTLFAGSSLFEEGKENLEVLLSDVNEKISEVSEAIENERNFIMRFIDIWNSWRHFFEFNKEDENMDPLELKNWKKEGLHFLDQWSSFKTEYRAREKKIITTDELLDKLFKNGSDRLVSDYKNYVDKVIKKVTEDSFRFSLVGNEIDGIFALKNFDKTTTELEESNISSSDNFIDIIVNNDIDNLISRFDSIQITDGNKQSRITIQIEDLHHSDETSGIIDDHDDGDDRTTESGIVNDDRNFSRESMEFYVTDEEVKPKSLVHGNICISTLRVIFSTSIFALVIFYMFILYYGREEFLPCCLREFWWTHFRRSGRTPY